MQDRLADIESRLTAIERRLSALEESQPPERRTELPGLEPSLGEGLVADVSAHIGRVLLIFGGAYLLRAITDHQFVPTGVGISMGATYALYWLFSAHRKAAVPATRTVAALYAGTSVLLAFPLLVEAVSHFRLLSGQQGLIALVGYFALGLGVAIRRNLRTLAWLVVIGGIVTAFAIMILAHNAVSVSLFLLALGIVSLWTVYRQHWLALQWAGAVGANAGAIALVVFARSDQWSLPPRTAALVAGALLLAYLVSFAIRTHRQARDVGVFEPVQALVAVAIVASAAAAPEGAGWPMLVGGLSAALGAGAYALAFSPVTRHERGRNFYFYSSLGLLLVLAGTAFALPRLPAAAIWALLAVGMAWASGRTGRVALSLQCTLLLVAAAIGSGLLATGLHALARDPAAAWPPANPAQLGIALVTVVCLFLTVAQRSDRWGSAAGLPQLVVLALSVWEVGGLFVQYTAPVLAGVAGPEPDLGVLAALRTAVLSVASVTLALSSLHRRWPEARWLVYPVLFLVGVKLFLEDFPVGRPETLFVALAFVGGALLLVARISRLRKSSAPQAEMVEASKTAG